MNPLSVYLVVWAAVLAALLAMATAVALWHGDSTRRADARRVLRMLIDVFDRRR